MTVGKRRRFAPYAGIKRHVIGVRSVERLAIICCTLEIFSRRESLCRNRFAIHIKQPQLVGDVLLVKDVIAIIHITNTAKVFFGSVVSSVSHGDDARLTGTDVNFRPGSIGVRRRKYDEGNLTCRHVTLAVLRSHVASDRCVFSGDRLIANAVEGKHIIVARVFRGVDIQSGPRIRLRNLLVVVSRHRFLPTGRHRQDAVPDKPPELYAVATKVWFPAP